MKKIKEKVQVKSAIRQSFTSSQFIQVGKSKTIEESGVKLLLYVTSKVYSTFPLFHPKIYELKLHVTKSVLLSFYSFHTNACEVKLHVFYFTLANQAGEAWF